MDRARNTLGEFRKRITDRLKIYEDLSHQKVNPDLALSLQSLPCVENANTEHITVEMCNKIGTGLYCTFQIEYLVNPRTYTWYIPVNYQGIELYGETKTDIIATTQAGRWGLLKCEDEDLKPDIFDYCKFIEYNNDCSKEFNSAKIDKALSYCNFTRNKAAISTYTEYGYLIQGENLKIRIKDPTSGTYQDIRDRTPVLIKTNRIITIDDEENKIVLNPAFGENNEIITYSWLSDKDIDSLEEKVKYLEFMEETDSEDLIDLILIILMGIILPVIGIIVKNQCTDMSAWEEKINMKSLKNSYKGNLKDNKKVIRATRV